MNYSGMAFRPDVVHPAVPCPEPPKAEPPAPPELPEAPREEKEPPCKGCLGAEKNPLTCFLEGIRNRGKSGFDSEDLLLLGIITLLLGKEGNEDMLLILAMLLLL